MKEEISPTFPVSPSCGHRGRDRIHFLSVPILSPSGRTGCAPAYELCSAWFLIALSMPEKIIA